MSCSTGSKVASVAIALVGTWATAQADVVTVSLTPSIALDHLRIFSEQQVTNDSTTVLQNQALSADFGAVGAGSTATFSVNTSFEALTNQDARVGLLGTSGQNLLVGTGNMAAGDTFFNNYGSSVPEDDVAQADAYSAVGTGDLTAPSKMFTKDDDNKSVLITQNDVNGKTGNLLVYDAVTGTSVSAGNWTVKVQAVPEPGTLAALGLGAFAAMRRRKRA